MFVIRLKMIAAYQQLELDLNFLPFFVIKYARLTRINEPGFEQFVMDNEIGW